MAFRRDLDKMALYGAVPELERSPGRRSHGTTKLVAGKDVVVSQHSFLQSLPSHASISPLLPSSVSKEVVNVKVKTTPDTLGPRAGIAAGLVGTAAVIGVAMHNRPSGSSMLQIIPVMGGGKMLGHYNTYVPYDEPENMGMYEYQAKMDPASGWMGTNTAFIGSHDGSKCVQILF